ncbi:NADP-dependent oxidoreductase [Kitasatospora paracochleata]|uniref:NADPH:quinone reductase-like Zn-dependent oxidoreductase n=1 Tax=Kitasatospora paracochleata TaxID=58354 RepID=A0ABT1J654_9ACTN|nr:NADP-dependent oxidoreductase [Kitasatospora paracochleata]MCP2312925.1 NADPH:quinone reductase-like Zn-dependent oxidoreductase [Kitasatospora paracochleata]
MSTTNTMKAITQDTYGGPEVLREVEVERPVPGPSEVLVRVHAAGMNPTDWKHRQFPGFLDRLPLVLGWDVSGVVEAVGIGVTIHRVGDEVFGMLPYPHGVGAFAEYVVVPARALVRKPSNLDHVQAGAVPLAALTAWQVLVDAADVRPGRRVLVHAAAGGVGHFAVQIAKDRGAYVIGTASAPKHELLHELGVDEAIDYRTRDFTEIEPVDLVFDTLGGETALRSLDVLRPGGRLISIALGTLPAELRGVAEARGIQVDELLVEADQEGMRAIRDLVEDGRLRPVVDAVFPLAQAAKGHATGDTGRVTGKVVLAVAAADRS